MQMVICCWYSNSGDGNQQYNFKQFVRDNNTDKFTMNQSFTIDFMKGLSLKLGTIWYYSEEKQKLSIKII